MRKEKREERIKNKDKRAANKPFLFSLFFFLFFFALFPVFPVELTTELQLKNPSPRLLPQHEELQRFVSETMRDLEPGLMVETLSLYHKPSEAGAAWSEAEQLRLFHQLTAISTLAGIQYYSNSRKAMHTFYESSWVIDSPERKKNLPDPVHPALPNSFVLYARQKDLTFGDNMYRFDYHTTADAIFFVQENVTPMNVGIIPAVGRNRCRTIIAVIDSGDSLILYAAAMAKAVTLPGMGDRIGSSFTNRIEAILQWFTDGVDAFN